MLAHIHTYIHAESTAVPVEDFIAAFNAEYEV
jgi:hypothetical protein